MDIRQFMKRKVFLLAEVKKKFQKKNWELRFNQYRLIR